MTPKTPAEQHLEVIEDAERMAKTVAAADQARPTHQEWSDPAATIAL